MASYKEDGSKSFLSNTEADDLRNLGANIIII